MAGKAGCSYDRQNSIDPTSRSEILLCNLIGNIIRKEGVGSLKSAVCGLQSSKWPLVQDFPWCCGCVARLFSKRIFSIRVLLPKLTLTQFSIVVATKKMAVFWGCLLMRLVVT